MDLLERAKHKLKEQEAEKQEEIFVINKKLKDDKPIEIEDLKPPKAPKISVDIIKPDVVNKITFEEIANSSEFKRLVYLIQFGKTHRGKSADLERKLIKRQEEITIIKEIERGSKGAFKVVVKELKERLAKQKVKIENESNNTVADI